MSKCTGNILVVLVTASLLGTLTYLASSNQPAYDERKDPAFQDGWKAAQDCLPAEACPWAPTPLYATEYSVWKKGWMAGKRAKPECE